MPIFQPTVTPLDPLWKYNGVECVVVRPLTQKEADLEEVGPMFEVRFLDGFTAHAFAYELQ